MDLTRHIAPFDSAAAVSVLQEVFGDAEAESERLQMEGSEAADNLDIVYLASEDRRPLGMIHATVPRAFPTLCGLSGMCVTPAARGRGIGRQLFAAITEEIDRRGVETALLGTHNPVAAKLYHSFGFAYLPGSNVMARYTRGDTVDFTARTFGPVPERFAVVPGSPALRIPIIPLVLHRGGQLVLDCNVGFCDSSVMTQVSCMGLYQRYEALQRQGGQFRGAVGAVPGAGSVLGAAASVLPTEAGSRADFFCCRSYEAAIPALLDACGSAYGKLYLHLADADTEKRRIAASLGYRPTAAEPLRLGPFTAAGTIWRKT